MVTLANKVQGHLGTQLRTTRQMRKQGKVRRGVCSLQSFSGEYRQKTQMYKINTS